MSIGNLILYMSILAGALTIASLYRDRHSKLCVRIFASLLFIDISLLTYYFVISDFSVNYVWQYSNIDLPLVYKLSAVLAGQQGTLLFWVFLIGVSSLLLNEMNASSTFLRGTLVMVVLMGMYFAGLTIVESPFEPYPDSAIPGDGYGLNPLLIDPWMAVHPPLIFLGYAAMTVPFALAIAYLLVSRSGEAPGEYMIWIRNVRYWCRISWLFLTLGIAVGGFWSYKVLGWGGFWAWDPVETSSLIPWILLTGTLHSLVEHGKNKRVYNILAPALVAVCFILVIYATLVTRSGFFESVHAFGSSNVETYLVALIVLCVLATVALVVTKYLNTVTPVDTERPDKEPYISMRVVFYVAILLFIVLTFISFWGTIFPAIAKIATGRKYGVGMHFYNIWSYPLVICLMLLAGFGINYSSEGKKLKELSLFILITLVTAFINPSDWNIVDYSAVVSPEKPFLYTLIGSISAFSLIPPSVYLLYSISGRGERMKAIKKRSYLVKEAGILSIHAGVVLVLFGAVFSTLSTTEFSAPVSKDSSGAVAHVPNTPFAVKLLGYDEYAEYSTLKSESGSGMSIAEFYDELHRGTLKSEYTVRGLVADTLASEHATYLKLTEGDKTLWVATNAQDIHSGINVVATGSVMFDFGSETLNRTFDVIMLSNNIGAAEKIVSITREVRVAVYQNEGEIAEGVAQVVQYPQSDVKRVMIDRGVLKDVYVIFSGVEGNQIPLNIKILPLVNFMWFGIILLVVGVIATLASRTDRLPR